MRSFKDRFTAFEDGQGIEYHEREDLDPSKTSDRICWILEQMDNIIRSTSPYGSSIWFWLLEHVIQSANPAALVGKFDKRLYDQLSDIAALNEIRQLWA
jgi:hypothetical protein